MPQIPLKQLHVPYYYNSLQHRQELGLSTFKAAELCYRRGLCTVHHNVPYDSINWKSPLASICAFECSLAAFTKNILSAALKLVSITRMACCSWMSFTPDDFPAQHIIHETIGNEEPHGWESIMPLMHENRMCSYHMHQRCSGQHVVLILMTLYLYIFLPVLLPSFSGYNMVNRIWGNCITNIGNFITDSSCSLMEVCCIWVGSFKYFHCRVRYCGVT